MNEIGQLAQFLHHTKTYPLIQAWNSMLLNKALYFGESGCGWWLSFKTATVGLEHTRFCSSTLHVPANIIIRTVLSIIFTHFAIQILSTFSSFVPVSLFNYHPSSLEFPPLDGITEICESVYILSWIRSLRKNNRLGLKVPKSVYFKAQITSRLPSKNIVQQYKHVPHQEQCLGYVQVYKVCIITNSADRILTCSMHNFII